MGYRLLIIALCSVGPGLLGCGDPPPSDYPTSPVFEAQSNLGSGDKIRLRVEFGGSGEANVIEREYTIDSSGEIAVPYIDIVKVEGRSPAMIRDEIKKRLADGYLKNPIVQVDVLDIQSRRVAVMGEVKNPGQYPYAPSMTILDAITAAGGFTPMSRANAVTVLRRQNSKPIKYTVPVGEIQNNRATNFPMRPGDVINVPQRVF